MRLQTQVQGKPYKSQEAEEQSFTEDNHESNQAMQNETSVVRGKREVIHNLTFFCNAALYQPSTSTNGCVKGWYYCRGYADAVCKTLSFQCLSNVGQYGIPKCSPEFVYKTIENKKVRITKTCRCA